MLRNETPGRQRPRRHWRFYGITILLGLFAGLAVAEAWVRIVKPWPRVQMVRGRGLHAVDGVPLWDQQGAAGRQNRACVEQHPERTRILFLGSSITYGSGLSTEEAFSAALEAHLNQVRPTPGFCVLNFAQPGFSFEQKYVVARREVARYKPALIMWENWLDWFDYAMIGETAYGIHGFALRPDGFIGMAGVPDALNRILLLHSRFYEYLTLAVGTRTEAMSDEKEATVFASTGAKLVMYLAPPLDRPFAETTAAPPGWHRVLLEFAQAHAIPMYLLQRELIDQDYLQLRADPCCHYNAAGHRALVPVMERIVLEQLDRDGAFRN
jgi:hypothetical protein